MRNILKDMDAIIFDMDGTMIDSMWVWTSVDDDFLEKYHLTRPETFDEGMEGMSFTEVAYYFKRLFPSLTQSVDEIMDEWVDMARYKYLHEVPLKDGLKEFLLKMKEQGKKIGIATSNTRELVDDTLEALGIHEHIDLIRSACEVAHGKPAPDVYLSVASELQVTPEKCMVFEDVPMGILAGKNAGMYVCAIEDESSAHQVEKKKELADFYINDYFEVL